MLARQIRTSYEQSYERILVTVKPVSVIIIESRYYVACGSLRCNWLDSNFFQYRGLFVVQNISFTIWHSVRNRRCISE